jgi:UDP-N-acetylmuramyl pentapeptide phosphotransferase/UDP-N-acetylglucosamine-1-phosphate transferase
MSFLDAGVGGCVLIVSAWVTKYLASSHSKVRQLDKPNSRSLHRTPTPRTGGIAVFIGLAIGILLVALRASFLNLQIGIKTCVPILGMLLLLSVISFWDDRMSLPVEVRLVTHAIASAGVVIWSQIVLSVIRLPALGAFSLRWVAIPFSIFYLMWMINLYNFMDGMDGFAGGMAVIGFGFLSYLGWNGKHGSVGLISLLTAAAACGFLFYNLPPARIFMGDLGSTLFGFLAGTISLMAIHDGLLDVWVPLLIFSPFIVDSTVTLSRRLLNGERVWQAHRGHYYQRLVIAGWSHRKTTLVEYCLMIACGVSAVAYSRARETHRLMILVTWVVVYVVLAFAVRTVERGKSRSTASLKVETY